MNLRLWKQSYCDLEVNELFLLTIYVCGFISRLRITICGQSDQQDNRSIDGVISKGSIAPLLMFFHRSSYFTAPLTSLLVAGKVFNDEDPIVV